jgi:hypothetical protein
MTLEHAAFAAYAVLDQTAHLVNQVLQIGVNELNTSFTSVLGKYSSDAQDACLRNRLPSSPLTAFWLAEQSEWIAKLRDMRHEFAHRGAACPVYGPNEKLLAMSLQNSTAGASPFYDVEEVVSGWFCRAEHFFLESLRLLAEHCLAEVRPYETSPTRPPIESSKPNSEIEETLQETLRLLFATDSDVPQRDTFLYARFSPNWRSIWPIDKFRAFLSAIDAIAMAPNQGIGYFVSGDTVGATASVVLSMSGQSFEWRIRLEKERGKRAFCVLSPMTVPQCLEVQTVVTEFLAKQSGRETKHRCAEFQFTVENIRAETLKNVSAVVVHGNIEVASTYIGELQSGQSRQVRTLTTPELGMMLPPGGPFLFVTLISEPVVVRVVYDREDPLGNRWADEHQCVNRSPRA